eukprot:symbB.v1.2.032844.t1/scaffold3995.1/size82977/8
MECCSLSVHQVLLEKVRSLDYSTLLLPLFVVCLMSINRNEQVAVVPLQSSILAALRELERTGTNMEGNVQLKLKRCSCGEYYMCITACRELIKGDVLVPVTGRDPQIIVQFDGSAHRASQVGGAGAALLQYDGNGLALLDWDARVLPKCADNIVAEANGADLAMHLYEKYVRMCHEQSLIPLPLSRIHGDIKQLLHHLDFRSRLRRNDLIPLINTFHRRRSRAAPNAVTEYRPRETNVIYYLAGQASAWIRDNQHDPRCPGEPFSLPVDPPYELLLEANAVILGPHVAGKVMLILQETLGCNQSQLAACLRWNNGSHVAAIRSLALATRNATWGGEQVADSELLNEVKMLPIRIINSGAARALKHAFNRLGLTQWEGIEEDIAWGHVTSLMGLARPSIEGPLFIYRAPIQLGGPSPSRVQIRATIHSSPEPILSDIASRFEDLGDPVQVEPWRLIPIDTSRGMSTNRELHHPCYMLVDFRAFRSFGLRPHGVMEVVLGQEEFSFPTVLPVAVNVVSLGEFPAPWLLTGLPGLQWQAWINGDLVGLALVACQEGFFLQVQVWCGPTLMQNMVVAAPLLNGTLHFDMDAITDTSLVRVTIYIPGGNTLTSSRALTVTCRFSDLRGVSFRVTPVHPVVTWHAPVLPLNKEKMILIYEDVVLQLDAVVVLRLHLPPYCGEGAIYCPRRLRKRDLIAQLGIHMSSEGTGWDCMCYVNSVELTNGVDMAVEDGDVIWCLRASPDMGHEIEVLSVCSPTEASEEEVTEIHVFRVILQSSWDKNACTRTVTRTDPMGDSFQTLERIIDEWPDLELEEQHQSWRLFPVNRACTWSSANELSSPAYVLTRKGNPFHFLRPHGVLDVVWGHRQWTTAIALPKWINKYHCLGIFARVCGPMLTPSFACWCDNTRLREELVEDAEMDSGAVAHGQTAQEEGQQVGKGLTRLPAETPRTPGPEGVNFQQFCDQLRTNLPGDSQGRGSFDTRTRFVAGDPGARFGSAAPLEYEVTGEIGRPHWELVFEHVLRQCGYLTEFHTVYNRDLANHQRQDSSLPHWPPAARWWHSRLKLIGPHKEKTELLLFPMSASTGLHHVHPTWAGTFVLAALVAVFPGINFVLLDSSITEDDFKEEASNLAFAFWDRIGEFLKRSRTCSELSPDEKTLWIQSGLALSPLMGTCLQYSLDFCLAWALIGEWTSRVLFPVPKGPWPRHGHAGALLQNYQCRSPRIVAWARAAFEQGALPSLLMMPGIAPVFSLPGDRMFQATEITEGRQRPAIMHGYGGAKAADLYQAVHLHTLEDLGENGPYPKVISQLALRIITYEYPLEAILAIYYLSATGYLSAKFPHDQWNEAVRWHGDTKLAATIQNEAEWADAKIILAKLENVVVEAESQHGVVVWSSTQNCPSPIPADSYPLQLIVVPGEEIQRHLPETLHVEATGLGGRDLLYPIPWDISIRSDKEGQSIYGPSLAPMEETVEVPGIFGGTETVI